MNDHENQPQPRDPELLLAEALEARLERQPGGAEKEFEASGDASHQRRPEADALDDLGPELDDALQVIDLLAEVREGAARRGQGLLETFSDDSLDTDRAIEGEFDQDAQWWASDLEQIGRFEILNVIGRGGFGIVFCAWDPELQRRVALKIPRWQLGRSSRARHRFQREARAAAGLNHPGIVAVYESGSDQGIDYLVCEWIDGEDLATRLARGQRPDATTTAEWLVSLADALHHAHQRGVLHRDLKPGNILLREGEDGAERVPLISDFGLAAVQDLRDQNATQTGAALGTPAYMSPEQAAGDRARIGPATDVYGLGAILYELLTGAPPFRESSILKTLKSIDSRDPTPPRSIDPAVPKDLEAICLKCLEKEPSRRYVSAQDLQADLQRYRDGRPITARHLTSLDRIARWTRRNPVVAMLAAAVAATLTIGLVVSLMLWRSAEASRYRAELNQRKVERRSEELEAIVDRMMGLVHQMPEITLRGMEPLRKQILEDMDGYYASLLADQPSNRELRAKRNAALLNVASLKLSLGDPPGAIDAADKVLGSSPPDPVDVSAQQAIDARVLIARASHHLNHSDRSRQLAEQVLASARAMYQSTPSPSVEDSIEMAKTLVELCDLFGLYGDRTTSNQLAEEAVAIWESIDSGALEPDVVPACITAYRTAAFARLAGEDRESGREYCHRAIELLDQLDGDPAARTPRILSERVAVHYLLGISWRGDLDKALAALDQGRIRANELSAAHPLVPRYRQKIGQIECQRGLSYFVAYLKDPNDPQSDSLLETGLEIFGQNAAFLEQCRREFPLDQSLFEPGLADTLTMIGLFNDKLGNDEAFLEAIQRSIEFAEDVDRRIRTQRSALRVLGVRSNLAEAYVKLQRYEEAIEVNRPVVEQLETILESDPENGEAARFVVGCAEALSQCYRETGQYDLALASLHKAMTVDRQSPPETRMASEAILLVHLGDPVAAADRFGNFVDFQRSLLVEGAEWIEGRPASPSQVDRALPRIVWAASRLVQVIGAPGDGGQPDNLALKGQAIDAAVAALRDLDRRPEFGDAQMAELLASDALQPLRATEAFREWAGAR